MAIRRQRVHSALYHTSFSVFLILLAALLVGSAWGLGEQAWRTDHQRRWNMFALVAAYAAIGVISVSHIWSRVLSVKRTLRTMPKPYVPTKKVDLPKKVANHIATEYSRSAVIAYLSQATADKHEGWGSPGTKWEGIAFRPHILDTLPEMRRILFGDEPHPPSSLNALTFAAQRLSPGDQPDPLAVLVASYVEIVARAKYARAEPTDVDADAVDKVVGLVRHLVPLKRQRLEEAVHTPPPTQQQNQPPSGGSRVASRSGSKSQLLTVPTVAE